MSVRRIFYLSYFIKMSALKIISKLVIYLTITLLIKVCIVYAVQYVHAATKISETPHFADTHL
ncbi:hypothetical protein C2G38_2072338 [Gigaspora rosea]|uniref:Uncharacterized protein n=1 Tax=Gigaspora rosea TaxID=44941 RepID=A0A397VRH6_9GLOM|nr:hypothetical protein C2G38_2072338 [Gigaspora rosea]